MDGLLLYGGFMVNQFQCWAPVVLLAVVPCMAQDVISPEMPNVDVETEEIALQAGQLEAVDRVGMLGCVLTAIVQMEVRGTDLQDQLMSRFEFALSGMPLRLLDDCPADFRRLYLKSLEEANMFREMVRKEKMDDVRFMKALREYSERCREIRASVEKKYQLDDRYARLLKIMKQQLKGLDRSEKLTRLHRMKEDLISGKMKLPARDSGADGEF